MKNQRVDKTKHLYTPTDCNQSNQDGNLPLGKKNDSQIEVNHYEIVYAA